MGRPKKVKTENEAFCDSYGRYDCYYAPTPAPVFGPMAHQQMHGQISPPLALQQPLSYPNSSYSSDDSGIESDTASSPLNPVHSPDILCTTIKSEPQEFFGSSCRVGNCPYDNNKSMDQFHQNQEAAVFHKQQGDVKTGPMDMEDFFLSDPVELDTEDMNDVLATLGQVLGSMGQHAIINSKSVNQMGSNNWSPFEGDYSEKFPSPISQQPYAQNLTNPLNTYQGSVNMQDSVSQGYSMHHCVRYKHWSSQNNCMDGQFAFAHRQMPYPCYSS